MLTKLQQEDEFCKNILKQIEKGNIVDGHLHKIENNILKRFIVDGDDTYETTVIPRSLTPQILQMAHDELDIMEHIEHIYCLKDYSFGKDKN